MNVPSTLPLRSHPTASPDSDVHPPLSLEFLSYRVVLVLGGGTKRLQVRERERETSHTESGFGVGWVSTHVDCLINGGNGTESRVTTDRRRSSSRSLTNDSGGRYVLSSRREKGHRQ